MDALTKILIVEDDPIIRANLCRTLQLEGYEVLAAEHGEMALVMAFADVPDLILSDVMMPKMDGHELLKTIRADERTAHIPFVFLTARADRNDMREGMRLGADDYLSKPFLRHELLELVQTQLSRQTSRLEAKRQLLQETQRLRKYDMVTELLNRQGFEDALEDALKWAYVRNASLTVISVTLNSLHSLRQSHGVRIYDHTLRVFASRLFDNAEYDLLSCQILAVARICDSSFALILSSPSDTQTQQFTRALLSNLATAVNVENQLHYFQPAAGVAVFPKDGPDALTLMQNAEAAEPESLPGGNMAFFCLETNIRLCRRMQIMQAMNSALTNEEFHLCYQPQIHMDENRVIGFEALLRWQHPIIGNISPAEFIPLAEDCGLIIPIGGWVLHEACRQMKIWLDNGFGTMRIAVNLSARQFENAHLPDLVRQTLKSTGLAAEYLELEITESLAMQNAEHVLKLMQRLTEDGVALAMDDFGTGYSNLSYLKSYPLSVLKIDQIFVRQFLEDVGDEAIIKAILALAQSFKLAVIAEGVETESQADGLKALGCNYFQGYLFSKPLTAGQATDWLQQRLEHRHA